MKWLAYLQHYKIYKGNNILVPKFSFLGMVKPDKDQLKPKSFNGHLMPPVIFTKLQNLFYQ